MEYVRACVSIYKNVAEIYIFWCVFSSNTTTLLDNSVMYLIKIDWDWKVKKTVELLVFVLRQQRRKCSVWGKLSLAFLGKQGSQRRVVQTIWESSHLLHPRLPFSFPWLLYPYFKEIRPIMAYRHKKWEKSTNNISISMFSYFLMMRKNGKKEKVLYIISIMRTLLIFSLSSKKS